jgi:hypothetical protein
MSDTVLLIIRVPDTDEQGVDIRRVQGRLNVTQVEKGGTALHHDDVVGKAFLYARRMSKRLVVLQILTSDLLHWGYNDTILPGPAKTRYIGHIREQIATESLETIKMLKERALQYGVSLEIKRVETMDPLSTALEEALGDYDRIFLFKERKKVFPIFERTIGQHLRKKVSIPIVQ